MICWLWEDVSTYVWYGLLIDIQCRGKPYVPCYCVTRTNTNTIFVGYIMLHGKEKQTVRNDFVNCKIMIVYIHIHTSEYMI